MIWGSIVRAKRGRSDTLYKISYVVFSSFSKKKKYEANQRIIEILWFEQRQSSYIHDLLSVSFETLIWFLIQRRLFLKQGLIVQVFKRREEIALRKIWY